MKSIVAVLSIVVCAVAGCAREPGESAVVQAATPTPVVQASNEKNRLPAEAEALLRAASTLELFSLDPTPLPPDAAPPAQGALHGYRITGRASLSEASPRKALAELVLRGIRESDGSQAKCFKPRHGIRVEQGAMVLELVICYECLSIEAYGNVFGKGVAQQVVLTSQIVEPEVTSAFGTAGLIIAGK